MIKNNYSQIEPTLNTKSFGFITEVKEVFSHTIRNSKGMELTVIDFGATITSLQIPMPNGEKSAQIATLPVATSRAPRAAKRRGFLLFRRLHQQADNRCQIPDSSPASPATRRAASPAAATSSTKTSWPTCMRHGVSAARRRWQRRHPTC